jgi:hypothetical protein
MKWVFVAAALAVLPLQAMAAEETPLYDRCVAAWSRALVQPGWEPDTRAIWIAQTECERDPVLYLDWGLESSAYECRMSRPKLGTYGDDSPRMSGMAPDCTRLVGDNEMQGGGV